MQRQPNQPTGAAPAQAATPQFIGEGSFSPRLHAAASLVLLGIAHYLGLKKGFHEDENAPGNSGANLQYRASHLIGSEHISVYLEPYHCDNTEQNRSALMVILRQEQAATATNFYGSYEMMKRKHGEKYIETEESKAMWEYVADLESAFTLITICELIREVMDATTVYEIAADKAQFSADLFHVITGAPGSAQMVSEFNAVLLREATATDVRSYAALERRNIYFDPAAERVLFAAHIIAGGGKA